MSELKGFCIMYTYDVAVLEGAGDWDDAYTANRNQQSDNGEFVMVTGIRDGSVQNFDNYPDMEAHCLSNGWTVPEEEA